MSTAPYRIVTPRLVLRPWRPEEAESLVAAVTESLEHLRAWMDWAAYEPQTVEEKRALMRRMRGAFDLDQDYTYGILAADDATIIGGTGLHPRAGAGSGALEIGYWIHAAHVGRGYATEAAAALTTAGFRTFGAQRLRIHCDPRNARSAAVARKLGYTHEGTLRATALTPDGAPRDTMVWGMLAAEHATSAAARVAIEMYDIVGRRIAG